MISQLLKLYLDVLETEKETEYIQPLVLSLLFMPFWITETPQ